MLAMLAVFSVSVTSCSDDDSNGGAKESALIGTWHLDLNDDEWMEYTFTSDKKFVNRNAWYEYGKWDIDTDYGTWSLSGTTVTLRYDDGDSENMTLDGKNLILGDGASKYIFYKK